VRLSGLRVVTAGPRRLLRAQAHFCEQLHAQVALRPLRASSRSSWATPFTRGAARPAPRAAPRSA
jgi:hypothetical protein